ncbi:hypothetical protein BLL52_0959 [Rhodoferax antarcticus ANT.BR]|uniref:Uncharacterized protein n=1 Tax=Rhodoferax antarcticus ANT.BR TaxID=1111071 RepID=A0A1Q8YIM2_9BURK|nr:hypothetical protein BLL52_0959 [Rhodoferax antarcticus ANT.BR]
MYLKARALTGKQLSLQIQNISRPFCLLHRSTHFALRATLSWLGRALLVLPLPIF